MGLRKQMNVNYKTLTDLVKNNNKTSAVKDHIEILKTSRRPHLDLNSLQIQLLSSFEA